MKEKIFNKKFNMRRMKLDYCLLLQFSEQNINLLPKTHKISLLLPSANGKNIKWPFWLFNSKGASDFCLPNGKPVQDRNKHIGCKG